MGSPILMGFKNPIDFYQWEFFPGYCHDQLKVSENVWRKSCIQLNSIQLVYFNTIVFPVCTKNIQNPYSFKREKKNITF